VRWLKESDGRGERGDDLYHLKHFISLIVNNRKSYSLSLSEIIFKIYEISIKGRRTNYFFVPFTAVLYGYASRKDR
jgi:hypothetical protein